MTGRQAGHAGAVPMPGGPYSQAVRIGSIAVCAGQVGAMAGGVLADDLAGQVRQALQNVLSSMAGVGAASRDIAQVRVFLTEREHFGPMNEVYRSFFDEPYPVRTTVYVGLAAGLLVEVDALAVLPAPP